MGLVVLVLLTVSFCVIILSSTTDAPPAECNSVYTNNVVSFVYLTQPSMQAAKFRITVHPNGCSLAGGAMTMSVSKPSCLIFGGSGIQNRGEKSVLITTWSGNNCRGISKRGSLSSGKCSDIPFGSVQVLNEV